MLRATVYKYIDEEENAFYIFEGDYEELRFGIPMTASELVVFESCLEGCLYQGVEQLQLEFCRVKNIPNRSLIEVQFFNHVPIPTFVLQKEQAVNALFLIRKYLDELEH